MEYKVDVAGTEYFDADIRSANLERPLFDDLGIGNACEAMFEMQFRPKSEIPIMAKITPYALVDSLWEQLGVFYIDERSTTATGIMTIIAYDSMLMADVVWTPNQSLEFPMPMTQAVSIISGLMGVSVDSRTVLNASYEIDYPANNYTLRDVLKYIAAAHGGNWIITRQNQLLLVPLVGSLPEETNYLVTETGDAITFAGVRILV